MFVRNETLFCGTPLQSELEGRLQLSVRSVMNLPAEALDARETILAASPDSPALVVRRDLASIDVAPEGGKLRATLTLPIEGDVELLRHRVDGSGQHLMVPRQNQLSCRLTSNLAWAAEQPLDTYQSDEWFDSPPESSPGAIFTQTFPNTAGPDEVRAWASDVASKVTAGAERVNMTVRAHLEAARTATAEAIKTRRAALKKSAEMRFDRGI